MSKKTPTHVVEYKQFEIEPPAPVPFWLGFIGQLSQYSILPAFIIELDGSSPSDAVFVCMVVGMLLQLVSPEIAKFAFLGAVCSIPCVVLAYLGIPPIGQVFMHMAIIWYYHHRKARVDLYEACKET
jgi:hypothetical protein